ncbi:acetylornithine deacetylase [Aquibaculum arenosum]|uniref:Acetylornithine deacetylase n=1 Tax=Aquibaculum arenosum TaxID=3032591 RepID=A0ABT5YQ44_9PROT|nr:acetylornithine deacetylase [Fodinicurvata sp. CAU 1616]MDF2097086.1 acetylornithine deacetylase [Fodinicurvata sp. CAU 1616]
MTDATLDPKEMIARLIAFPTVSSRSNLDLIDWVEERLTGLGARCRRTANAEGTKANLFASIGPDIPGGIVLSGHSDVVPVEGQTWSSDPFTLTERDGRLYGRGTADMKSFLAIALALAPEFAARPLRRPIHLAFSYDEEVGCLGVGRLIEDMTANLPLPDLAIIGEPTDMRLVTGHKAIHAFRTSITGRPAHSSQPHRGAGAIFAAGRMIEKLWQLGQEKRQETDPRFEPPWTTVQVGTIEGGTALNILPGACSFVWEYRSLPSEDATDIHRRMEAFAQEEVLPALREFAPEADIVTEPIAAVPPLRPEREGAAEALVRRLTGANESRMVAFTTEGGLFQQAGLSTVVCGPGSIDQAHQPDEFIELSQVEACTAFLRRLADWACEVE